MDYFENLWNDTFADFEGVFTIKTILGTYDLNFLGQEDLMEIANICYELGFEDLPRGDEVEGLYGWQTDDINEIFMKWYDLFNGKYLALKRDLFSLAITGENG